MATHTPELDERPTWLGLTRPAGWIDRARRDPDGWVLEGWFVLPNGDRVQTIRAHWNGVEVGVATPLQRADLADSVYWTRDVASAGFSLRLGERDEIGRLDLIGERGGRPVARLSTTFMPPELESSPLPPAPLAERVSDVCGDAFRLSGLQASTDIWDRVRRHAPDPDGARMLDWGCGCARIARYMPGRPLKLLGCDIDVEAVEWCAENIDGEFSLCAPDPPLPYADGEIDVVYASSVFTHLSREQQQAWLREIRRALSDDGILVASVAGRYAYLLGRPMRLRDRSASGSMLDLGAAMRRARQLKRAGIVDDVPDAHLDGIAPPGYYRSVFQSREYTQRAWGREFEIIDYIDRGLNGHQDLVVMRAPKPR